MEPTQARIELVREDGTIRMGGTDVSMEDMARMLGVFAAIVAAEAVKRGMGVEEVKDAMLDIFLAATARLDEEHAQDIREGHTWDMGEEGGSNGIQAHYKQGRGQYPRETQAVHGDGTQGRH